VSKSLRITKAGAAGLLTAGMVCSSYGSASAAVTTRLAPATVSKPNLIVNGNFAIPFSMFRNGAASFWSPQTDAIDKIKPAASIRGWVVGEGWLNGAQGPQWGGVFVDQEGSVQPPPNTTQSLRLGGQNGPGNIEQAIKTTPGATYVLSWYGAEYPMKGYVETTDVMWDGKLRAAASFRAHTATHMGWVLEHETVKATGSRSVLEFIVPSLPGPSGEAYTAPESAGTYVGEVSLRR
jgi:hypothetical protein